jgi:hypothetical protein
MAKKSRPPPLPDLGDLAAQFFGSMTNAGIVLELIEEHRNCVMDSAAINAWYDLAERTRDLHTRLHHFVSAVNDRHKAAILAASPAIVTIKAPSRKRGASFGGNKTVERRIVTAKPPSKIRREGATR